MITIYKYPLLMTDQQQLYLPGGSEILCVQVQHEQPCIWVRQETTNSSVYRTLRTYGTGHQMQSPSEKYIGTYQLSGGQLVFHVFEVF